ncbi:SanA/YdcF family protein [Microlunatus flavus]|uniref:Protein SanA, affects membrane permeability for vancomycin n=1 Tax=Microlunatus flavus TaxID=1036181 RepID=A0A1H9LAC0_9ACTN|nr:ElyC/SanA/YdcF family protein [Microlunatus flavus]SER08451.1 protein SanA, affects membrane permeability for vancomycin [Microlunatus flavus]
MPTVTTQARRLRRGLAAVLGLGLLAGAAVVGAVAWVRVTAAGHTHADTDLASVPAAPVALVLGAQVYPSGRPSPFLAGRLDLAKKLFDEGLVRVVLVSGDNMAREYNEPDAMRSYLLDRGMPADKVVADYAGFDTYDSCARAQRIFGVDELLVVTQGYHLPRAVATCRALGLDAHGVGDFSVSGSEAWRRGALRDQLATVKTVWDVVSRRDPVLGQRETSIQRALQD